MWCAEKAKWRWILSNCFAQGEGPEWTSSLLPAQHLLEDSGNLTYFMQRSREKLIKGTTTELGQVSAFQETSALGEEDLLIIYPTMLDRYSLTTILITVFTRSGF